MTKLGQYKEQFKAITGLDTTNIHQIVAKDKTYGDNEYYNTIKTFYSDFVKSNGKIDLRKKDFWKRLLHQLVEFYELDDGNQIYCEGLGVSSIDYLQRNYNTDHSFLLSVYPYKELNPYDLISDFQESVEYAATETFFESESFNKADLNMAIFAAYYNIEEDYLKNEMSEIDFNHEDFDCYFYAVVTY